MCVFWPCEALATLLTVWPAGFSSPLGQLICQSGSTNSSVGPRVLHPQQQLTSITFILPSPVIISPNPFHFFISSSCSLKRQCRSCSRLFSPSLPRFLFLLCILLPRCCNFNQFPYCSITPPSLSFSSTLSYILLLCPLLHSLRHPYPSPPLCCPSFSLSSILARSPLLLGDWLASRPVTR